MTRKRRRRSLVRGNKIYVYGSPPPRWRPPIESIPVDYTPGPRASVAEDEWLPDASRDEFCHPDEIGDVAAAVALINEVLGDVGDGDALDNGDTDSDKEPQP